MYDGIMEHYMFSFVDQHLNDHFGALKYWELTLLPGLFFFWIGTEFMAYWWPIGISSLFHEQEDTEPYALMLKRI